MQCSPTSELRRLDAVSPGQLWHLGQLTLDLGVIGQLSRLVHAQTDVGDPQLLT